MKRFYKKGMSLFLILLMSFPLCACKSDDSKALTTVKLNEVAHSIFYAPMYVAIEKGYFEDEGIELSLTTGFGADKTMAAVVSGDADVSVTPISLCPIRYCSVLGFIPDFAIFEQ